jgi:glycosyltransferase involved in cell wall biosynthesis
LIPLKLSVVIPSYNSAPFLDGTIRSVLRQTHRPHDVWLIDDGSTDGTEAVAARFGSEIHYVKRTNQGVSKSRNHGAEQAAGDWLLFLDSDDQLLPHAAESLLRTATESAANVAYGMVIWRHQPGRVPELQGFDYAAGAPPLPAKNSFWRSVIPTPGAAIVHRSVHEGTGGFVSDFHGVEDRDYFIKCGLLSAFAFCDTVVLDKGWREGSLGSLPPRQILHALLAQLACFDWCRGRGIDTGFLETDRRGVIEHALKAILWTKSWSALPAVLEKAREHGVGGYWVHRARWQARFTFHG